MICLTNYFNVMGLFRKKIDKKFDVGLSAPIFAEKEVTENLVKDGIPTSFVEVKCINPSDVLMPTREQFDLEEQLAAGIMPQAINVKGILSDDDGQFDAIAAFNSLQSQIDSISSNVESTKSE